MEPNSSAILAIAQDKEAESVINSMEGYNANIVTFTVGDQLSGEIAQYVAAEVDMPEEAEEEVVEGEVAPAAEALKAA